MSVMLNDVVRRLRKFSIYGKSEVELLGITHDSRKIQPGWMFVAIPGDKADGHNFIATSVDRGAVAIVAEREPDRNFPLESNAWITVESSRDSLGYLASAIYGDPTREMSLIGITGTNGKTTLTYLLESIAKCAAHKTGVVGTISYRWEGVEISAPNTTPEASDLQKMFREMRNAGVSKAFMEVSSHGLRMGRLNGCDFDIGLFTNLTQDHLDYHLDMEDYYQAKKLLFSELLTASGKKNRVAIINADDPYGQRLLSEISGLDVFSFGSSGDCDFHPLDVRITTAGISGSIATPAGPIEIESCLTGAFNLSNIMAAVAVSSSIGITPDVINKGIARLRVVPGRLQRVVSPRGHVFVDYAHTPNALANVLDALRKSCSGRIITLVGCGGDRDRAKRPLMGEQAAMASDFVLITSDNPRSENPLDIIDQIEPGVKKCGLEFIRPDDDVPVALPSGKYTVIPDRGQAIKWVVRGLSENDTLLVAGKGHETYQEIKGVRYPFDDSEELRKAFADTEG